MENNNEVNVVNGTQSQMEPAFNGGELMPVNNYSQENGELEMTPGQAALAIAGTMLAGYGMGKLGEFLWKKLLVPGYVKAVEKIDDWKSDKDDRIAVRKKSKKNKDEVVDVNGFKESEDPDENQDEEQSLPKKGMKSISGMKKNRRR